MFKKNSIKKSDRFIMISRIPFNGFLEYVRNYTRPGDYILAPGGKWDTEDAKFKVLRYEENYLTQKNAAKFLTQEGMEKIANTIMEITSKLPATILHRYVEKFRKMYDGKYTNDAGTVDTMNVWLPISSVDSKEALMITLVDRITILVT